MKISERIIAGVKAFNGAPDAAPMLLDQKASPAQQVAVALKVGIAQWAPYEYRRLVTHYAQNPIVHRCVTLISEAVAGIEPVITENGRENSPIVEKVAERFKRPNPEMDRGMLAQRLAAFDALHGNAFVEMVRVGEMPVEFHAPRPEFFQIIPGVDGWPAVYRYEANGARRDYRADIQFGRSEILHIRRFNPSDDIWGLGCLWPAKRDLEIYERAQDMAKALFDNGATPSGAMVYKPTVAPGGAMPTLTEEQFQRVKRQMQEQMSGAKNTGKPIYLEGGMEWQQFGMTMVDLGAEEIRNEAARGIARAFGVPPMLLGIPGDNTYSNYSEANRAFYRATAIPSALRIYGAIGRWWAAWVKRPIEFTVDADAIYALAEEVDAQWARLEASTAITLNEKREAMGYQPLAPELGDQVYADGFRQPLGATIRTAEAGAVQAEIGVESADVALQYQIENPAYDPAKDADGDGTSSDNTGKDSTKNPAKKKEPKA
ncbi:MAG: phage portal protein [Beijerinckiaceae bacterium]